jgi:hypothetical protein
MRYGSRIAHQLGIGCLLIAATITAACSAQVGSVPEGLSTKHPECFWTSKNALVFLTQATPLSDAEFAVAIQLASEADKLDAAAAHYGDFAMEALNESKQAVDPLTKAQWLKRYNELNALERQKLNEEDALDEKIRNLGK